MNQLCKHICWKVFGFIADRYYVDNMATFLCGFWCCFKLANLIITGGLLEKKKSPALYFYHWKCFYKNKITDM